MEFKTTLVVRACVCGSVQWFTVGGSKKVAAACGARERNVKLEPQLRQGSAAPSTRRRKKLAANLSVSTNCEAGPEQLMRPIEE